MQTARMKGLTERRVLYGHVFRNAMLIVIAGFPGAFVGAFFTGSLLIEQVFSLDGPRLSLLRFADPARLSGRARQSLYLRADRPRRESALRPHLYLDRSAHRFRNARGLELVDTDRFAPDTDTRPQGGKQPSIPLDERRTPGSRRKTVRAWSAVPGSRRSTAAGSTISVATGAATWSFWIFLVLFVASLGAEFIANDRPLIVSYKGELSVSGVLRLSRGQVRRLRGARRLSRCLRRRRDQSAWLDDLAADPLCQPTTITRPADAAALAADLDAERGSVPRCAREAEGQGRRDRAPSV